jgi:hypothetical protein
MISDVFAGQAAWRMEAAQTNTPQDQKMASISVVNKQDAQIRVKMNAVQAELTRRKSATSMLERLTSRCSDRLS